MDIITTMIGECWSLDGSVIGKLCIGYRPAMSTVTPGDIASTNCFYLRTLCMNHCVIQHVKLPLWPIQKLGIER